jgi:sarcosine oxidase
MKVVVVGGGVVGLLTAMELVERGSDVILVEQGTLPNPSGTSYDAHRIVRALHPGDAATTHAAARARQEWTSLARLLGEGLAVRTGSLTALPPERVESNLAVLRAAGERAEALNPVAVVERLGHVRFSAGTAAILETDALVVLADRVLAALVRHLRAQPGVVLRSGQTVVAVEPGEVRLADGSVERGDRIVLAAGPWSQRLLPIEDRDRLTLHRQTVLYCRAPWHRAAAWAKTPAIPSVGDAAGSWLVPPVGRTPLKLSAASASRVADRVGGHHSPGHWRNHLVEQFSDVVVGFDPTWVLGSRDYYYLADSFTGGASLMRLFAGEAWAFAACGGTSFKFAPLVARVLVQRALGNPVEETGLPALDRLALVTPPPASWFSTFSHGTNIPVPVPSERKA